MKKVNILIAILVVLGGMLVMVINNDHDENDSNPKDIHIKNEKNVLISKDKINQRFNPVKNSHKQITNISMNIEQKSNNENLIFVYKVKNEGKTKQVLKFRSSQRYDYQISDTTDKLIYQYSKGKSFLQALKAISLEPGEELVYEIFPPKLAQGKYQLSVNSVAEGFNNIKKTINFIVEGS